MKNKTIGVDIYPRCADPLQVIYWMDAARLARAWDKKDRGIKLSVFCSDCTVEYQSQMILEGRCDNPGHVFYNEEEVDE